MLQVLIRNTIKREQPLTQLANHNKSLCIGNREKYIL